jgi:hypothetical protein
VFGILAVQAAVCADGRNKTAILVLLVDIRDNTSRSARQDSADKLEKLIRDMNPADRSTISPETIDAISALLSDSDDYVVYMAAAMLGHIGVPTALRSVPWLLKSLREIQFGAKRDQRFVDVGPIDTIVGALQSLKVCVPKPGENGRTACDYLLR